MLAPGPSLTVARRACSILACTDILNYQWSAEQSSSQGGGKIYITNEAFKHHLRCGIYVLQAGVKV